MKINNMYDEYQYFLQEYLLPLLGISYDKNLERVTAHHTKARSTKTSNPYIHQVGKRVYFSSYSGDIFFLRWKTQLAEDDLKIARSIIRAFFGVSKYRFSSSPTAINIEYKTDAIREENYRLAVQKGICDWCAGTDRESFYQLIQILEQWSVQTYEGKKVTFGFIYDPQAGSNVSDDGYGNWLDFLKDDYAATLTDCIHSVIKLDKNCNFSEYLSVTENNMVEPYQLSTLLPYRFARIIDKYVTGSCVGVFLLNNGDILISKNRAVRLIKRNLKWLNLSCETFVNMVQSKIEPDTIQKDLIEQIYASVLDVSFAHTGGIIAVVSDVSKLMPASNPILNVCDDLLDRRSPSKIAEEMKGSAAYKSRKGPSNAEIEKRMLKRKVMLGLVAERNFSELDRKLRTELISMDGACILDPKGNICAVGAIIRNDSGSSGGGRSAAARKLSKYGGFAVKISTDGYIELFINYKRVYAIK